MHTPIPIDKIYQPARLTVKLPGATPISTHELLQEGGDAVIFAGPGRGKTTLLHHIYVTLAESQSVVPVLFTLRWPGAPSDLADFVEHLSLASRSKRKVIFLVDGYDEITPSDRQLVSRALLLFQSLKVGQFFLTCRTFYEVSDLKCSQYTLDSFSHYDAVRFVEAFGEIYEVKINARTMIADLEKRGFGDFISHPLMLTLVCILQTGPNAEIPRRAIGLIRRAIETLTFRWDEGKNVSRTSQLPLDGEERVRCLMRIAFTMKTLQSSDVHVDSAVREHLALIQLTKVNPRKLVEELARWYGILVPVDDSHWQFVHRTIHDYLAARFWVESGVFASTPVSEWSIRAAYAVCLLPDATDAIVRMLDESSNIVAFSECLYNRAPFDTRRVALAVISRTGRRGGTVFEETGVGLMVRAEEDFYAEASPEFLRTLVELGSSAPHDNFGNIVACYALSELSKRGIRADQRLLSHRLAHLYSMTPHLTIDVRERPRFELLNAITPAPGW